MQQAVKSKYTGRTTMAGSKIKEKDILGEKNHFIVVKMYKYDRK